MREIKFRAWDKEEKKFITLDTLQEMGCVHIENDGVLSLSSDYRFLMSSWLMKDRYSIQQYTGLKDKNGKEIYEGDILKFIYTLSGAENIMDVRWKGKCFKPARLSERNQKEIEIIGNIYENPELLTNK